MKRLLPLSLVLLGACLHHHAGPVMLRPGDSGKSIEVAPGQTITLRLPATLSTGYTWQVTTQPDARVLIVTDRGYSEQASAPPGAPAEAWWKLRATGAGTTDLALRYVRPWEPDKDAGQFTLTVTVKQPGIRNQEPGIRNQEAGRVPPES